MEIEIFYCCVYYLLPGWLSPIEVVTRTVQTALDSLCVSQALQSTSYYC